MEIVKKIGVNNLKTRHFPWLVGAILVFFLTAGVLLYWLGVISVGIFVLGALGILIIGFLFVFGIRVAQKNGFVDGFKNGRDGVKSS